MQKLTPRHGAATVLAAHRFVARRLASRPAARKLAEAPTETRLHISSLRETWLDAREARIAATAELEYVDSVVDGAVASVAREALVLARGDRNDSRYRKLFPEAPSTAMRGVGSDSQDTFVRALVARLDEEEDLKPLKAHARVIERAADAVTAARKIRDELFVPEQRAATDLAIAIDDACRAYNQLYPRLQLLFPSDTALVESFFPRLRRTADVADADDNPVVEPSVPTPVTPTS